MLYAGADMVDIVKSIQMGYARIPLLILQSIGRYVLNRVGGQSYGVWGKATNLYWLQV